MLQCLVLGLSDKVGCKVGSLKSILAILTGSVCLGANSEDGILFSNFILWVLIRFNCSLAEFSSFTSGLFSSNADFAVKLLSVSIITGLMLLISTGVLISVTLVPEA